MSRRVTVLDLDSAGFVVASIAASKSRCGVVRATQGSLPESPASDEQVGEAIGAAAKAAGFKLGPTIVAVPRGDVSVKMLDMPGASALTPAELGETVRLQMRRQLTSHSDDLVIDYLPPGEDDAGRVVAAAMSREALDRVRAVTKAAGGRLAGVRLRSSGARAVAAGGVTGNEAEPLAVAWQPHGAEIVLGHRGRIAFVRGVDVPRPTSGDDGANGARRLGLEVSRTVVSYRVAPGGAEVTRVRVLGDDVAARAAADAISSSARLPTETVNGAELFDGLDALPPEQVGPLLPLLGLASLDATGERCLDFHDPLRPPDTSASSRQLALASVFALIVLGGAGYLFAESRLRVLDREIESLSDDRSEYASRYRDLVLSQARVGHAEAWLSARADLTAHLRAAVAQLPPPPGGILDEISLSARDAVRFTPGESLASPDAFASAVAVDARLSGTVASREVGADLRARLLELTLYDSVASRGPEVEGRFDLELRSTLPEPFADEQDSDADEGSEVDDSTPSEGGQP